MTQPERCRIAVQVAHMAQQSRLFEVKKKGEKRTAFGEPQPFDRTVPEVPACREPGAAIPPRRVREKDRASMRYECGSSRVNAWERDGRIDPSLRPVTFFIFLAGAAGAGIVATDLVVIAMDGLNRGWFFATIERELRLRA